MLTEHLQVFMLHHGAMSTFSEFYYTKYGSNLASDVRRTDLVARVCVDVPKS